MALPPAEANHPTPPAPARATPREHSAPESPPTAAAPPQIDSRALAANLAPLVVQACNGQLCDIRWFKADWQRGGAATALCAFQIDDDGSEQRPAVLKLPVATRELLWTQRLQNHNPDEGVVPRLFASGETIGGYDLAWVVIEKLEFGPLGLHWHNDHVARIAQATAKFHATAAAFEVDQPPRSEDWHTLLAQAAESARVNHIGSEQRWTAAIKTLRQKVAKVLEEWNARDVKQWLHGDLHLANAMSRVGPESGPVCLIDLAEVHAGHWIEDAIYLERQLWARPDRLKINKPVKAIAAERKMAGLQVDGDYPRLAMIRRALLAGTAPAFIKSEGHPAYLEACLNWLEIALNELK